MTSCSLWDGAPQGTNLVRILYLDESGTSSIKQDPYLIVGGVIVHGDHQLHRLRGELKRIVDHFFPVIDRPRALLHATSIYSGTGYFKKNAWTREARFALLDELARLPAALNLCPVWHSIDRAEFHAATSAVAGVTKKELSVGAAYMQCLIEADLWFKKNAKKESCLLIVEDEQETREYLKALHRFLQTPEVMRIGKGAANLLPLMHIQEDPLFQEKRAAHPLALADFIVFVVKRVLQGDQTAARFYDPWKRLQVQLRTLTKPAHRERP